MVVKECKNFKLFVHTVDVCREGIRDDKPSQAVLCHALMLLFFFHRKSHYLNPKSFNRNRNRIKLATTQKRINHSITFLHILTNILFTFVTISFIPQVASNQRKQQQRLAEEENNGLFQLLQLKNLISLENFLSWNHARKLRTQIYQTWGSFGYPRMQSWSDGWRRSCRTLERRVHAY